MAIVRKLSLTPNISVVEKRSSHLDTDVDLLLGTTLADAELRFNAVLESLAEGVAIFDPSGVLIYCNNQFELLTGYSRGEIYGKKIYDIFFTPGSPEQDQYFREMLERYRARQKGIGEIYQSYIYRKDGTRRYIETKAAPLKSADGNIIGSIGANTDVTDRVILEQQLRWSQRLETVGQVAGGIAHRFGNLLTTISGYIELLAKAPPKDNNSSQWISAISKSTDLVAKLTKQLLALSNESKLDNIPVNLNQLVKESIDMLRGLLDETTTLETDFTEALPSTLADQFHLQQIFVHLVSHIYRPSNLKTVATYPTGDRARVGEETIKISISTKVEQIEEVVSTPTGELTPGRYVVLVVARESHEQSPNKEVDPNLSAAESTDIESNIGLSTSIGIANLFGGALLVETFQAVDVRAKLYLPVVLEQPILRRSAITKFGNLFGSDSILLIEPDLMLRRMMAELIRSYGYTVCEAEGIDGALNILTTNNNKLDLVLICSSILNTDENLAHKIKELRIDISIVVMASGTPNLTNKSDIPILWKPFSPSELLSRIRTALDNKPILRRRAGIR